MPKFVDVGVAKPSFSSAYILTFKLNLLLMLCPAILYIVHCRRGTFQSIFKHVQMLDITLCVNQFEASTFPFQAAPLEFKLLRKTLLKCPIQVQDSMVISFRKVKSATVRDKTLLFQMRNLTSPVQILHPSKAKFNFPTPWAWTMGKSLWVAWGGDVEALN